MTKYHAIALAGMVPHPADPADILAKETIPTYLTEATVAEGLGDRQLAAMLRTRGGWKYVDAAYGFNLVGFDGEDIIAVHHVLLQDGHTHLLLVKTSVDSLIEYHEYHGFAEHRMAGRNALGLRKIGKPVAEMFADANRQMITWMVDTLSESPHNRARDLDELWDETRPRGESARRSTKARPKPLRTYMLGATYNVRKGESVAKLDKKVEEIVRRTKHDAETRGGGTIRRLEFLYFTKAARAKALDAYASSEFCKVKMRNGSVLIWTAEP